MPTQNYQQKITLQPHNSKNTTTITSAVKIHLDTAIRQIRRKEALSNNFQSIRQKSTDSNKISVFPHKILLSKY